MLIYRIGGGPQAPRSALPVGAEPVSDRLRVAPVSVNQDLHHLVLAVSFAKEPDEIMSRYRNLPYLLHLVCYECIITYFSASILLFDLEMNEILL